MREGNVFQKKEKRTRGRVDQNDRPGYKSRREICGSFQALQVICQPTGE